MLLKMKKLTESIENKYSLNEAISKDIPEWLWKRLFVADTSMDGLKKRQEYASEYGGYPSYKYPRYGDTPNLYKSALDAGFDLARSKVVEAEIPKKFPKIDPTDTISHVFRLKNNQVYIPGLNDLEQYDLAPGQRTFKGFSKPKLIDDTINYAYIDWTDPANQEVTKLKDEREENKKFYHNSMYRRNIGYGKRSLRDRYSNHYDSSGYLKNANNYESKLKELKFDKLASTLTNIYNDILSLKLDFSSYISSTGLKKPNINTKTLKVDWEGEDTIKNNYDIIDEMAAILEGYTRICNTIEGFHVDSTTNIAEYRNYIIEYSSLFRDVDRLKKRIAEFEEKLGDHIKVIADW